MRRHPNFSRSLNIIHSTNATQSRPPMRQRRRQAKIEHIQTNQFFVGNAFAYETTHATARHVESKSARISAASSSSSLCVHFMYSMCRTYNHITVGTTYQEAKRLCCAVFTRAHDRLSVSLSSDKKFNFVVLRRKLCLCRRFVAFRRCSFSAFSWFCVKCVCVFRLME